MNVSTPSVFENMDTDFVLLATQKWYWDFKNNLEVVFEVLKAYSHLFVDVYCAKTMCSSQNNSTKHVHLEDVQKRQVVND